MKQEKVLELLKLFEANGIKVTVDGGWAVDALLGKQTREHNDLDIAVDRKYEPKLRKLLVEHGYKEVPRDDSWEANFVLSDSAGSLVDIHTYTFDDNGNNIFGVEYPNESLQGTGSIGGRTVKCISPKFMVGFIAEWVHKWPQKYSKAIPELCAKYDIPLPQKYKEFVK